MRSLAVAVLACMALVSGAQLLAQRPSCGPAAQPKALPTVSFLIDSSGALRELQAAKVLRDSMQFTLVILPGDSIPVIHAIDSANTMAANVLARSVWPEKPTDLWAVRVHVAGGAAPALTLSRATYCPPVLVPGSSPVRVTRELRYQRITSQAELEQVKGVVQDPAPVPAVFDVDVTARGDVKSVKVFRSSGRHEFDEEITRQLVQQKYEPALLDGIPIPATYRSNSIGYQTVKVPSP